MRYDLATNVATLEVDRRSADSELALNEVDSESSGSTACGLRWTTSQGREDWPQCHSGSACAKISEKRCLTRSGRCLLFRNRIIWANWPWIYAILG